MQGNHLHQAPQPDDRFEARPRVARIEDWRLTTLGGAGPRLDGVVFDHPDPEAIDGTRFITSELISLDEAASLATTHRTTYHLGRKAQD